MRLDSEKITRIYNHIIDDSSKEIFEKRIIYGLTNGSISVMKDLASANKAVKEFFDWLENEGDIYIYTDVGIAESN